MTKQVWKPGNMLYPVPVVMVSCATEQERDIVTVAWAGTVCSDPVMLSISVRPERYSHHIIRESGEFVVSLVDRGLVRACDWCGVRSGRDHDKYAEMGLTAEPASSLAHAPLVAESPVSIECAVAQVLELGSHDLFLAEVKAVQADESLLNEHGGLELGRAGLVAYSHGEYAPLGRAIGSFGFSVRKRKTRAGHRGGKGRR